MFTWRYKVQILPYVYNNYFNIFFYLLYVLKSDILFLHFSGSVDLHYDNVVFHKPQQLIQVILTNLHLDLNFIVVSLHLLRITQLSATQIKFKQCLNLILGRGFINISTGFSWVENFFTEILLEIDHLVRSATTESWKYVPN